MRITDYRKVVIYLGINVILLIWVIFTDYDIISIINTAVITTLIILITSILIFKDIGLIPINIFKVKTYKTKAGYIEFVIDKERIYILDKNRNNKLSYHFYNEQLHYNDKSKIIEILESSFISMGKREITNHPGEIADIVTDYYRPSEEIEIKRVEKLEKLNKLK